MTNLINSLPRFGLEESNGVVRVFDYATNTYHTVEGEDTVIESTDGVWNAFEVAELIRTQQQVFGAFLEDRGGSEDDIDETQHGRAARTSRRRIREHDETLAQREHRDEVEQAKRDFLTDEAEQRQQAAVDETGEQIQAGAAGQQQSDEDRQRQEEEARKRSEEEQRRQQEAQNQQNQGGAPA